MKKLAAGLLITSLLVFTGCAIQPLSVQSMHASQEVYNQIEKNFYLKHKIEVMPIRSKLPPKLLNSTYYDQLYANATQALAQSLDAAGMLADKRGQVQYSLNATLIDVQDPQCFFGTCETGSTVQYELKKGDRVVYSEMLVVPQNYDYPVFGADMVYVIRESLGVALGNNFAHLIHVLSTKTEGELK